MGQLVKNLPAVQETWLQSLGWEDPLEKGKTTHPLQYSGLENSMDYTVHGFQRVGHNFTFTFSEVFLLLYVTKNRLKLKEDLNIVCLFKVLGSLFSPL